MDLSEIRAEINKLDTMATDLRNVTDTLMALITIVQQQQGWLDDNNLSNQDLGQSTII